MTHDSHDSLHNNYLDFLKRSDSIRRFGLQKIYIIPMERIMQKYGFEFMIIDHDQCDQKTTYEWPSFF